MSVSGQIRKYSLRADVFRFAAKNGHRPQRAILAARPTEYSAMGPSRPSRCRCSRSAISPTICLATLHPRSARRRRLPTITAVEVRWPFEVERGIRSRRCCRCGAVSVASLLLGTRADERLPGPFGKTSPGCGGLCADRRSGDFPAKARTVCQARVTFEHASGRG